MINENILEIDGLKKYYSGGSSFFGKPGQEIKAVDDVTLAIRKGETLGLVGESGCGKSTLGKCILRLEEPSDGRILFEQQDILSLNQRQMKAVRRNMQIVFQDPYSSLNPRRTVQLIIGEAFTIHRLFSHREREERIAELLKVVGLLPEHASRYPHQFSGGQRQRICIARALALNPRLIIADEPVSALDVSIQAQILNLLVKLQSSFQLTYLFISHDLSVVRHIADRVAVMYLGRIVEMAPKEELYAHPLHPYSQSLLLAVPAAHPKKKKMTVAVPGDVPSPANPPSGCTFHPRCPGVTEECRATSPCLREIRPDHWIACHDPDSGE